MGDISDLVPSTVSLETVFPSKPSFNKVLFAACHSYWGPRQREFGELAELRDAGVPTYHPIYRAASKLFSGKFRPPSIVVGKRIVNYTKTVRLYPLITTEGYVYTFTITDTLGVDHAISYTVTGSETTSTISEAIEAVILLLSVTGVTADHSGTNAYLTLTATAGLLFDLKNLPRLDKLKISDVTADPGIVADVAEIQDVDPKAYYAVLIDSNSSAEIHAFQADIETQIRSFWWSSIDSDVVDNSSTTDIAYTSKAAAYFRSPGIFYSRSILDYPAAALLGAIIGMHPGSYTANNKTLVGVSPDLLTSGMRTVCRTKRIAYYDQIADINMLLNSRIADGNWFDVLILRDYLEAGLQNAVATAIVGQSKLPYTDVEGMITIQSAMLAVLNAEITRPGLPRGLASDPAPSVIVPRVADIPAADRANREVPVDMIRWRATLSGAIHKAAISGTLTV